MNLYLVLALALGVTAPTVSPRLNTVVAERRLRAEVCGPTSVGRTVHDRLKPVRTRRSPLAARVVTLGAASPRAPAFSC